MLGRGHEPAPHHTNVHKISQLWGALFSLFCNITILTFIKASFPGALTDFCKQNKKKKTLEGFISYLLLSSILDLWKPGETKI